MLNMPKKCQNMQAILEVLHQNLRYYHEKISLGSMPSLLHQVSDSDRYREKISADTDIGKIPPIRIRYRYRYRYCLIPTIVGV